MKIAWLIFFTLFNEPDVQRIEGGETMIKAWDYEWQITKVVSEPIIDGDKLLSAHFELECNGERAIMIVKNKGVVFTMFGDKKNITVDFEQLVHADSLYLPSEIIKDIYLIRK